MPYELKYRPPGPVGAAFLSNRPASMGDTLPIDGIIGPVGSGKSAANCVRIFCHALEQPPGYDGWRRSLWAVVRNTNPMLETTTIRTWLDWFPEDHFGPMKWSSPYSHHIVLEQQKVDLEVLFVPLDRPDQVKKLLSLELTGGWANEAREIPREIIVELRRRCGRFPSRRSGAKPGWAGVLWDTNAPEDEMHYLCMWAGWTPPPEWMDPMTRKMMALPENMTIFVQPPGLLPIRDERGHVVEFRDNPKAENMKNLRPGYYRSQLSGSTLDATLNMVCCEPRKAGSTRPVQPQFNRTIHVAKAPLVWTHDGGKWGLLGADFARNPAVVLAQEVNGQLRYLAEWVGENISVREFVKSVVLPGLRDRWPEALVNLRGWGDPSGANRTGGDDSTAFTHARAEGLTLMPAWTNDPTERQASLERRLTRTTNGAPDVLFSPTCTTLVAGLAGGYRLRRMQVSGTVDSFSEETEKNMYSHICEAAEYLTVAYDRTGQRSAHRQREDARRDYGMQPNGRVRFDPLAVARAARRGR